MSLSKNRLRIMLTWFNVSPAALNFGRFNVCGNEREAKSHLIGAVPIQAKAFSLRIPLASTTKQHQLNGFFAFIAAVLHTITSAIVGGVEEQT